MKNKLPYICPSCQSKLAVTGLVCPACETQVNGSYSLPLLASMSEPDQEFIINFVKASGSLKIMAKQMGLSYPTVRNKLDEIIKRLTDMQKEDDHED